MPGELDGAGLLPGGIDNPSLQPSNLGAPHLEGDPAVVGVHGQNHPKRRAEGISWRAGGCFADEPAEGFRLETGLISKCGWKFFELAPGSLDYLPIREESGFETGWALLGIHGVVGGVAVDSCAGWAGAWEASADLNRPFWAKT